MKEESEQREAWRRAEESVATLLEGRSAELRRRDCCQNNSVPITEWDPNQPRQPKGSAEGGQWAPKGGDAATVSGNGSFARAPHNDDEKPTLEMLGLAHAWYHTMNALQHVRDEIERLPKRIANTRAQLGSGGRYAYLGPKGLAKLQAQLQDAQSMAPELEKQLAELEQQYHDLGFDDVPYSTWTSGETIVGGKGIAEVGRAVASEGEPAGLERTGDEFAVAMAAGPVLRLGKFALSRAAAALSRTMARKSASTVPAVFEALPKEMWTDFPSGVPRPTGAIKVVKGDAYNAARRAANNINGKLSRGFTLGTAKHEVHEIVPLKFGGSPTDLTNKIGLPKSVHREVTAWFQRLQRILEAGEK